MGSGGHPLHYFPTFLARSITVVPVLETKTAISKILYQELGSGDPALAHERLYLSTMADAGFSEEAISDAAPLPATARLVEGYEKASQDYLSALGFLYGTEVADLAMVSMLGIAVRKVSEQQKLPWVTIHIQQEPEHVQEANQSLEPTFSLDEGQCVLEQAAQMWQLWVNFFSALQAELVSAREPALANGEANLQRLQ